MTDLQYKNIDPSTGSPEIQVTTWSSPLTPINNQVTAAVIDSTAPAADGCTNWSAAMIFKMDNLPNMTEFLNSGPPPAGLFEEYKLRKVCIEIIPVYGGKDLIASTGFTSVPGTDDGWTTQKSFPTPTMYFIKDYDNKNAINWPMIAEMNGVERLRLNRAHRIWVNPRVVAPLALNVAGPSVFQTTTKSPWITNKNLGIEHYGLRFLMQDWPGPSDGVGVEGDQVPFAVRFNIRYYFACRGTI